MAEKTVPAKRESNKPMETREESRYLIPAVDIYETKDGLAILCDLPGVQKDGVDVKLDDDVLTIQGKLEHKVPGDVISSEFELLNYYRQFHIGEELDKTKINANMRHGVLHITLPKAERVQPRKIDINVK